MYEVIHYKGMLKRIVHFVQYHNFFTIALMALFMGASASFAASPELQQSVLAKNDVVRSADNTFLVNTDFDAYDMGIKIVSVTLDADKYYVSYTYNTVVENDFVWQPVATNESMQVSKRELAGRDLGLYVADQLGQLATQQISYLKEVQTKEKKKGATQKVIATEYSGLVGRFLATDEKTLEGYTPVKPPPPVEIAQSTEPDMHAAAAVAAADTSPGVSLTSYGAPSANPVLTRDQLQTLIQEAVKQLLAGGTASTTSSSTTPPPSSSTTSPPPADTLPPPPVEAPPVATTTSPGESTPPVATTTPPVIDPIPPVATTTPPVIDSAPSVATTTLSATEPPPPPEPIPPADTTATTTPA